MNAITIDGEQYAVPGPEHYGLVEGQPLTAATARTLYQTLRENLSNNLRKAVREAREKGENPQPKVDEYATNYSFSMPGAGGPRRVVDPVEREALNMAKEAVKGALLKEGKGRKLKDVTDLDAKLEAIIEKNDLMKKAKAVVNARQKAGADSLEGVDLTA